MQYIIDCDENEVVMWGEMSDCATKMEKHIRSLYYPSFFQTDLSRSWCEQDYQVTSYVAEFYNTISNIVLFSLGIYGFYRHYKITHKINHKYILCILISLGSAWYHAVLSRASQLADELPMLYLTSLLLYEFVPLHHIPKLTTLSAIVYIISDSYPVFLVVFSMITCGVLLIPIWIKKTPLQRHFYFKAIYTFISGAIVWLIDQRHCTPIVRSMHLHALWHVCSGFALYWYIQFTLARKKDRKLYERYLMSIVCMK